MSYISGLSSIVKGERGEFFFNKDQFLFATNFATNPYFADELNWAKIAVYYKDATNNQKQIIILKDDNGRGWFAPSEMSRTGSWSVEKIEVYDKQGDCFQVTRSNMPSPETFDVSVQRIVAPSPAISAVVLNSEKVVNGTFDIDLSGWTTLAGAIWSSGAAMQTSQDGINERGFIQNFATIPERKYEYKATITNGSADVLVANGTFSTMAEIETASLLANRRAVPVSSISGQFTALSSTASIALKSSSSHLTATFDNVSIKEVPDYVELPVGTLGGIEEGFKVKIWDDTSGAFLSADVYEVTEIQKLETKDVVKLSKQIVGAYADKSLRLRFPSYTEVSGKQASLYQYVGVGY
ncbi:MAG: hypothetical protein PHY47_00220 [Lachnospiraceae bacterium]|nr:hypothetical protein [Lachnospiraceae bacterium]